jgi:thioredoxin reductase (NADPH)
VKQVAKPVILSVDDDLQVLNAIERDLRSHYGGEFRLVKAAAAAEALEVTRQLQQRGAAVALFLVDHRMPEMTGTELLTEVRKLYPDARKVLLTAYADTQAAISSINDVGLDHYLLKPWSPPEERLYPVLDDLLSDWRQEVRLPFDGIRVVGSTWSTRCYAVKQFLSGNQVPYQWIELDRDPAVQELIRSLVGDTAELPVVLFSDGTYLQTPTNRELADKVGIQTQAKLAFYDLIIIGAGPAGLAAAVYAASEGLHTLMIEVDATGGQAGSSSRIENYLGFPSGLTGADLARRATAQALRFGAEMIGAQEAVALRVADPYRVVQLADGTEVSTKALILASGVSVRTLDLPGIEHFLGAGLYYGAAMTEAATYRDRDVCILGGANSAGQGALFFSRYARKVTILVRADRLARRMSQYLVDRIGVAPNIEVITGVEVTELGGEGSLECITIREVATGKDRVIEAAALFVFIGAAPRTEMVAGLVERDDRGYLLTGPDLPLEKSRPRGWPLDRDPFLYETNVPGIFSVGDVRAGSGKRVASAVGEGSGVVSMVHRYLETV